jgi:Uma2 family endonuclease
VVVEVLSPSTRDHDRTVKARRYAALGIRHYWLVDPEASRIECYRTEAGAYALVVQAQGEAALSHPDWTGLTLSLADLWR